MITQIEALNYRCLKYINRSLSAFHVLVGPNASGKTTFLDVVGFLADIASEGLEYALSQRTNNPVELLHFRKGSSLDLAVEAEIPHQLRQLIARPELDTVRYEISVGFDDTGRQFEFKAEKLLLKKRVEPKNIQVLLFPEPPTSVETLISPKNQANTKTVLNKVPGGNDNFYSETYSQSGKGWTPSFRLGPQKSALRNLPADEAKMPVATWFREYLSTGVQRFVLNSLQIQKPSPPTKIKGFLTDGSNLPWAVSRLRKENEAKYDNWISHLQTSLPDLTGISTFERPEDRHCYLIYEYGDLKVPSWLVSDGTLRLTALTLPAYLDEFSGIYLIEEPENGIHPGAVETVYASLTSIYNAQVLMATHSPVVLNAAEPKDILCFAKTDSGASDIVSGDRHPRLREWKGGTTMGSLLVSGVLG